MKSTIAMAVVALLFLATTAGAQTLFRNGDLGDVITGDIHWPDESDIVTGKAVKGSTLKITIGPAKSSAYRAQLGVFEEGKDFEALELLGVEIKGGKGFKTLPIELPSTGRYRIRILTQSDANGTAFAGEYQLKTKLKAPKKFSYVRPFPENGEADAEFVAVAGSVANISIKAGPGSELPTLVDILRPDGGGSVLTSGTLKLKKSAITIKKVALPDFGEYRIRLTGAPFGSYRIKVSVKEPRRKALKVDVRDLSPPEIPMLVLSRTGDGQPFILFDDRDGGAQRYAHLPGKTSPREYLQEPPDGISIATIDRVLVGNQLVGYTRDGLAWGLSAVVSEITLSPAELLAGYHVSVQTPDGDGASRFSNFVRDPGEEITAYTEVRTYGVEGVDDAYTLRVRDIYRPGGTGNIWYEVDLTGPAGPIGTFIYPPWTLGD